MHGNFVLCTANPGLQAEYPKGVKLFYPAVGVGVRWGVSLGTGVAVGEGIEVGRRWGLVLRSSTSSGFITLRVLALSL